MAIPVAYTGELFRLGYGEQDPAAALETPVVGTTWIGKTRPGTLSGFMPTNIHDQKWFSGDGRLATERALHGVDIGPVSWSYEVQNGRYLALLFGTNSDEGTDVGGGGGSDLDGATVAGATTVTLTSVANYAISDYIQIGTGITAEIRQISGIAAQVLTLDFRLRRAHADAEVCNEVTTPVTHTIRVGDDFPIPHTLQGSWRFGQTNELSAQLAGCHGQEVTLAQDLDGELVATPTVIGSRPVDVTPPASLATPLTTASYLFSQAAYTYSSLPAVDGVRSHFTTLRNGGEMKRWSRSTNAEFGAEYVPDQAPFDHELTKIARRDDGWDALLARTDPVTGNILYTRGASDTLTIDFTNMVVLQVTKDNPEGAVEEIVTFSPGEVRLIFVDAINYY